MNPFPKEFLWGGAISNVQAEGSILADGKGLNVFDTMEVEKEAGQKDVDASNVAADHYLRFKEDIALMKEMSFKAFRFSIVWSRIFPTGTEEEPNEQGLAHYEGVIDELIGAGIEPVVTLVHFDMPDYLSKQHNGFYSREVVGFFARHVEAVVKRFAKKVRYWITFNEMNTATMGHSRLVAGAVMPEGVSRQAFFAKMTHNTQLAHAKAVSIIKKFAPEAKVCGMINYYQAYPQTDSERDAIAADIVNRYHCLLTFDVMTKGRYPDYYLRYLDERGLSFMDKEGMEAIRSASEKLDILAVSYYLTCAVSAPVIDDRIRFEDSVIYSPSMMMKTSLPVTDWGWTIDPEGIRTALSDLYRRYGKPVFVVENGIACAEEPDENGTINDERRISFYRDHIRAVKRSMDVDGSKVVGYLAWSAFDILSSHREMRKRYGFVYIDDSDDNRRIRKRSFDWYRDLIRSDGVILEEEQDV